MNPTMLPPLLHRLATAGLTLRLLDCERIEVIGDGLTDDMRQGIRELKPLLVKLLGQQPQQVRCSRCGSIELGDGKRFRWCLTCEAKLGPVPDDYETAERQAIQAEPYLGESLDCLARWFERREGLTPQAPPGTCTRCWSRTFHEEEIHGGQSIRRDCAVCDLTHSLPIWYGHGSDDWREDQYAERVLRFVPLVIAEGAGTASTIR